MCQRLKAKCCLAQRSLSAFLLERLRRELRSRFLTNAVSFLAGSIATR